MILLLTAWGCGASEPAPPPRPEHAREWEALQSAAERGDVATLRVLARDFSLGDVSDNDPSVDKLGAALGFLQVAEDPDDIDAALLRANAACAECHATRGVAIPR